MPAHHRRRLAPGRLGSRGDRRSWLPRRTRPTSATPREPTIKVRPDHASTTRRSNPTGAPIAQIGPPTLTAETPSREGRRFGVRRSEPAVTPAAHATIGRRCRRRPVRRSRPEPRWLLSKLGDLPRPPARPVRAHPRRPERRASPRPNSLRPPAAPPSRSTHGSAQPTPASSSSTTGPGSGWTRRRHRSCSTRPDRSISADSSSPQSSRASTMPAWRTSSRPAGRSTSARRGSTGRSRPSPSRTSRSSSRRGSRSCPTSPARLASGARILDVACGGGKWLIAVATRVSRRRSSSVSSSSPTRSPGRCAT